ncbi:MAG: hypothetical protein GY757_29695, partial [bacterium]|nr:hypothetical protein [bacterium]
MLSNEIKEILKKEYPFPPPDDSLAEKLANYIREGKPLSITGREGVLEELEDEFAKTMLSALRNTTNDEEIHDIASLYSYSLDRTENFLKLDKYRTLVVGELSAGLKELPGINPPVDRPYVTSRGAFYGYKA